MEVIELFEEAWLVVVHELESLGKGDVDLFVGVKDAFGVESVFDF